MSSPYRTAAPGPAAREAAKDKPAGLKLPPGATLSLEMEQDADGFTLATVVRVGRRSKRHGSVKRCKTEEELMMAIETWAQDRLAKIGREKVP